MRSLTPERLRATRDADLIGMLQWRLDHLRARTHDTRSDRIAAAVVAGAYYRELRRRGWRQDADARWQAPAWTTERLVAEIRALDNVPGEVARVRNNELRAHLRNIVRVQPGSVAA